MNYIQTIKNRYCFLEWPEAINKYFLLPCCEVVYYLLLSLPSLYHWGVRKPAKRWKVSKEKNPTGLPQLYIADWAI